ncbi:MAG: hypothetical protein WBM17_15525 [Anaerolineales bacterium]
MSEKIVWSFKAQVSGGPTLSVTDTIEMDAYDKIDATIPKNSVATAVEVQPGDGAKFLLILAASYEDLTYKVDDRVGAITLDGPHILIGEGAVSLLHDTQNTLTFTNANATTDNKVSILVGRTA